MRAKYRGIAALTLGWGIVVLVILTGGGRAVPQPSPEVSGVRLEAEIDRTEIHRNERFRFTVRVSWTGDLEGYEFQWPSEPECDRLTIVGTSSSNEVRFEGDDRIAIKRFSYLLQPTSTGGAKIGAVSLVYTSKSTGESRTLRTKALPVTVLTASSGDAGFPVHILTIALAAAISLGGAALLFRRRRRKIRANAHTEIRTPEDRAREELEGLKPLPLSGEYREYYGGIATLLRRYIGPTWGIECVGIDTSDVVRRMREPEDISEEVVERFNAILSECDLVKFAGRAPEIEEMNRMYTRVKELLGEEE